MLKEQKPISETLLQREPSACQVAAMKSEESSSLNQQEEPAQRQTLQDKVDELVNPKKR